MCRPGLTGTTTTPHAAEPLHRLSEALREKKRSRTVAESAEIKTQQNLIKSLVQADIPKKVYFCGTGLFFFFFFTARNQCQVVFEEAAGSNIFYEAKLRQ